MNEVEMSDTPWRRPIDSALGEERAASSRPPSYMTPAQGDRHNSTDSDSINHRVEGRLQYSELLRELNAYYSRQSRLRNGISRLLFNTNQQSDHERGYIKYGYACQSCISVQFKGIFMLFWMITFLILGIISVALGGLPIGFQAIWGLLLIYILLVAFLYLKRRKEEQRIKMLEEQFESERRQLIRQALLEQTKFTLPNNHYFEIHTNVEGHTHPIVTLLPPPPTYTPTN